MYLGCDSSGEGIKGSDLLGFDGTAMKSRIKGKNTAIGYVLLLLAGLLV